MNAAYETEIATSSMPQDALPYKHFRKPKSRTEANRALSFALRMTHLSGEWRGDHGSECAPRKNFKLCKIEQTRKFARIINAAKPGLRNRFRFRIHRAEVPFQSIRGGLIPGASIPAAQWRHEWAAGGDCDAR
jgi:hypothetical protein